ncbi:NADH-quinone oxidoreductase subunit G [Acidocella aquatica]|uniref:NADH-quinone oxidoreductase n=1 Tax=Acidocella aquatica TaxID=1922313 RepID=A0ABQ6A2I3_9PROT|nr:NADH-quinone oxidoreductase subunit NuoG [Acidocella aquatica]GLR65996.1 NADH-quinone oxidoreductase subunit G [Acidocella aquatica]
MAIIHIDGNEFIANTQHNLLQTCLEGGLDLPYFCWHPALGSVGACRQCAVKQFANPDDKTGRIVMACMTPAVEGTRISIADPEARKFRASVIEWMMTNHPHDCPVCEEGGECHLQDMTVMTGHTYRRYRFTKRTHKNQYLGPFIRHEMNRCIACYRCVRFYKDYAGGSDLNVQGAHNNIYFGRDEDGVLENEFSGNLVEICPTGVFTDKTLSSAYKRKWDLRSVPSVCVHCGVGCNTCVSEHGGQIRRILNRFNGKVNGYFLCDRGRFGYEFANAPHRLNASAIRDSSMIARPAEQAEILEEIAKQFDGSGSVIGIGSPRASLEANFALRALVGADSFYSGVSVQDAICLEAIVNILSSGTIKTATLQDAETADAILILGEDVTNTAPRLALALRQTLHARATTSAAQLKIAPWQDTAIRSAASNTRGTFFIASPAATHLDDVAAEVYRAAPDDIARLGFAICYQLDNSLPSVDGLSADIQAIAARIARALQTAKHPLIVAGCQLGSSPILNAAAAVAQALNHGDRTPNLMLAVPECNSLGLALMKDGSIEDAFAAAANGASTTVIVLENDLYRRAPRQAVDIFFNNITNLIALDHVSTKTTSEANFVLPCTNFSECEGTLVNNEGRAQRSFQAVIPKDDVQPGWLWLHKIAKITGRNASADWKFCDDVARTIAATLPIFAEICKAAPSGDFRIAGSRIRSEPHRYSGRTAVDAAWTMHEPKAAVQNGSPFSGTMEGYYGQMPAALIPFFWAPGWNSGQSLHKFQDEASGSLRGGDSGIRLLEPCASNTAKYPLYTIPAAFKREDSRWLVIPSQHIFGSEELSALAPSIAELCKLPYLSLNVEDAKILGAQPGSTLKVTFDSGQALLPILLAPELPSGVAAIGAGLPGTVEFSLPGWATILRAATEEATP